MKTVQLVIFLILSIVCHRIDAQKIIQTVKGTVYDKQSKINAVPDRVLKS